MELRKMRDRETLCANCMQVHECYNTVPLYKYWSIHTGHIPSGDVHQDKYAWALGTWRHNINQ